MIDEYLQAMKLGQRELKQYEKLGENPYPAVLNDILPEDTAVNERPLGIMEIPTELIAGTKEAGRSDAFSRSFYPLLAEDTEFAAKWSSLYQSQLDEGIREPIQVYEYMTRFYVQEGNKRISITRYLKMPTVLASVTRILPRMDDSPESRKYYEFVRFFNLTGLYSFLFTEYGSYEKLLTALGKTWEDRWSQDELSRLRSVYLYFSDAFRSAMPDASPEILGDGFLSFLNVFPYQEIKENTPEEIREKLLAMKKELPDSEKKPQIERVLSPEKVKTNLVDMLLTPLNPGLKTVTAAFLYEKDAETSDWIYAHELGRHYVEDRFGDRVVTHVYDHVDPEGDVSELLEKIAAEGTQVVFTATPKLMPGTIKAALLHPEISFFNCSLNFPYKTVRTYYPRMYEAKFLTGIIAGIMSKEPEIGYEAGYPIYGTIAEINAFTRGVRMVRPEALIRLRWTCLRDKEAAQDPSWRIISAKENISSGSAGNNFGLYRRDGFQTIRYAAAVINWGRFYSHILERMLNGTWKNAADPRSINYWWGISSGMLEVICSGKVPDGTRILVEKFQQLISWGVFHPFDGVISDQAGNQHGEAGKILSNEEIITMNWLCRGVIGSIPAKEELSEEAAALAALQGVYTHI